MCKYFEEAMTTTNLRTHNLYQEFSSIPIFQVYSKTTTARCKYVNYGEIVISESICNFSLRNI